MGFDPAPSYDFGMDCDLCEGSLWADGETPAKIGVMFSGIEACPFATQDMPNGYFILTQAAPGCGFWFLDAIYDITLNFLVGQTGLSVWDAGHDEKYFTGLVAQCETQFNNLNLFCAGWNMGINGSANIFAHPNPVPNTLLNTYGLETHGESVWDGFLDANGVPIYRLVDRKNSMNIRVKYENFT